MRTRSLRDIIHSKLLLRFHNQYHVGDPSIQQWITHGGGIDRSSREHASCPLRDIDTMLTSKKMESLLTEVRIVPP